MAEQVLDDMKRMLNFRPHAGLQVLQLFSQATQFAFGQRLAFGALHGHMPRHRFADVLRPLFHALVSAVRFGFPPCGTPSRQTILLKFVAYLL